MPWLSRERAEGQKIGAEHKGKTEEGANLRQHGKDDDRRQYRRDSRAERILEGKSVGLFRLRPEQAYGQRRPGHRGRTVGPTADDPKYRETAYRDEDP